MAERKTVITKTDRVIRVRIPDPGCACREEEEPDWGCWTSLYGQWMGEPGLRPRRKEDQTLEITQGYAPDGERVPCRDYMALLTYGQIKTKGVPVVVGYVQEVPDLYQGGERWKVYFQQIIEWFVEVVEEHWTPPVPQREPLAQYLARYLDHENYRPLHGETGVLQEQIEAGIQAYESIGDCQVVVLDINGKAVARVKGIINENKKKESKEEG